MSYIIIEDNLIVCCRDHSAWVLVTNGKSVKIKDDLYEFIAKILNKNGISFYIT